MGPMTPEEIVELKEFTKVALSGLASNPVFMDAHYQKQLQMRNITMETMAVGIAAATINQIQGMIALNNKKREESNAKPPTVVLTETR